MVISASPPSVEGVIIHMSVTEKKPITNRAKALRSTGPKTDRGASPFSNCAALPIRRRTKRNILKNEETNPFCQPSSDSLIHSPATNKQKVIMFLGGTEI